MSLHKDKIRFWHMLDHAMEAMAMVQGKKALGFKQRPNDGVVSGSLGGDYR